MKQASVKTLLLLMALLAFAVVCYSMAWTPSVKAALTWLEDDPNQPPDPNDPNEPANRQPEMALSLGSLIWLDDEPADPNDPNQPPERM